MNVVLPDKFPYAEGYGTWITQGHGKNPYDGDDWGAAKQWDRGHQKAKRDNPTRNPALVPEHIRTLGKIPQVAPTPSLTRRRITIRK